MNEKAKDEIMLRPTQQGRAGGYAAITQIVRAKAREFGYAIGLHGSMQRDLDLIAVPWTDDASDPESLVEAIRQLVGGRIDNGSSIANGKEPIPIVKPHGRAVWCIHLGGGAYIDLGVMPRVVPPGPQHGLTREQQKKIFGGRAS